MEDSDAQMQMERQSQAGDLDVMELEHIDDRASASASTTVPDADMEIHDVESEGRVADLQDSIRQDLEMAAEIDEQSHTAEERDWKDVDADTIAVDLASQTTTTTLPENIAKKPQRNQPADLDVPSISKPPEDGQLTLDGTDNDEAFDGSEYAQDQNSELKETEPPAQDEGEGSYKQNDKENLSSGAEREENQPDAWVTNGTFLSIA